MELKWRRGREARNGQRVLIVPLWNWNYGDYGHDEEMKSSNCTFMELKYRGLR